MYHQCYFAPLEPSRHYPVSPFDIELLGRPYDLPLTPSTGAYLAQTITDRRNEYFRSQCLSNLSGIRRIREKPGRIYLEASRPACFAEAVVTDRFTGGLVIAQVVVVSKELCAAMLCRAWDQMPDCESAGTADLRHWTYFFAESGGFELLRAWYCFSNDEIQQLEVVDGLPVVDYSQIAPCRL
jgi:hypothetical protein